MVDAVLWFPSLSVGLGALAGLAGWAGLVRLADPEIFSRITRALTPKSIAQRRLRKLDLDMIAQLSVDVDMAWWDEQFKKLTRATYRRDPELVSHVEAGGNGANWVEWMENSIAQVSSVTHADLTFSMKKLTSTEWLEAETADLAEMSATLMERQLETERVAKEAANKSCENCGYIVERTYDDGKWIKLKTYTCEDCREASFEAHKNLGYVQGTVRAHQNGWISSPEAIARLEQNWA